MPEPNPRRSHRPARRVIAWVAAAIVVIAMASAATSGEFLPSPEIVWLKLLLNAGAAAVALGAFVFLQRRQRARPVDPLAPADRFSPTGVSAIVSLIVFVIVNACLLSLLPLLHRFAAPEPATLTERAWLDESSGRGCRRMVLLSGDSALMRRRLCGISESMYRELAKSGRIEITGSVSYFGIAVQRYRAAPTGADAP